MNTHIQQMLFFLQKSAFKFVSQFRLILCKNYVKLLVLFLLIDTVYSFIQHSQTYLDGDIANIVLPSPTYQQVLEDPFGKNAMLFGKMYPGPNRYFAHASMSVYFKTVPFWVQYVCSPIDSIYWACALVKIAIQVLIILLLSAYISEKKITSKAFIIAAALVTPLFQASGYNLYMGIIDRSITYNFFYALPLGLLLLYFLPFYLIKNETIPTFSLIKKIFILLFTVFLSFNGPLIQPVILILCPSILLYKWYQAFQTHAYLPFFNRSWSAITLIPKYLLFPFIFFCLISFYSLYLGTFNIENLSHLISISERYNRLPMGLFNMLTQRIGFSLFVFIFLINILITYKLNTQKEAQYLLHILKWIAFFALIYLLLLPLGGYRNYRPNIVRYDTFMPILLAMMFFYGKSTLFIIKHLSNKKKSFYLAVILLFSGIMTFADKQMENVNACEKVALAEIANSSEKIVPLTHNCTVMAWEKITDYRTTQTNSLLLYYWGITKEPKLYYQK